MESQNNIAISGDEARILMAALRTSDVSAPMSVVLTLYMNLNMLSQVQPPKSQSTEGSSNER